MFKSNANRVFFDILQHKWHTRIGLLFKVLVANCLPFIHDRGSGSAASYSCRRQIKWPTNTVRKIRLKTH
jgi:hypothetical protein